MFVFLKSFPISLYLFFAPQADCRVQQQLDSTQANMMYHDFETNNSINYSLNQYWYAPSRNQNNYQLFLQQMHSIAKDTTERLSIFALNGHGGVSWDGEYKYEINYDVGQGGFNTYMPFHLFFYYLAKANQHGPTILLTNTCNGHSIKWMFDNDTYTTINLSPSILTNTKGKSFYSFLKATVKAQKDKSINSSYIAYSKNMIRWMQPSLKHPFIIYSLGDMIPIQNASTSDVIDIFQNMLYKKETTQNVVSLLQEHGLQLYKRNNKYRPELILLNNKY